MAKKHLVEIIKANPDAIATIDNDCWWLKKPPPKPVNEMTEADWDAYDEDPENTLARDGDIEPLGDGGYGSGNCYGGDLLQALAQIVGLKVESV